MGKRILILNGHPDATRKGLCGALADAYAEGAELAGHQVTRLTVAELDLPARMTPEEFRVASVDGFGRPLTLKEMAETDKRVRDYLKGE